MTSFYPQRLSEVEQSKHTHAPSAMIQLFKDYITGAKLCFLAKFSHFLYTGRALRSLRVKTYLYARVRVQNMAAHSGW